MKISQRIVDNRQYFMGLAIIMIIASHMLSVCKEIKLLWLFYPGFIGVDIFLFLSGYGLCHSWEKNNVSTFYSRRIKRILPMFLCFQFFISVCQIGFDPSVTYFDVICNFTTLSFWGFGGWTAEWYLAFLFYLYLLFPAIYWIASRIHIFFTFSLLSILVLLQYEQDWVWNFDAAFSRIPIFVMGIVCYLAKNKSKVYLLQTFFFFVAMLLFVWMVLSHRAEKYEIVYMFAPCFMLLASICSKRLIDNNSSLNSLLNNAGKVSIELYVANMMTISVVDKLFLPVYLRLFVYLILQFALSYILIIINRKATILISGK